MRKLFHQELPRTILDGFQHFFKIVNPYRCFSPSCPDAILHPRFDSFDRSKCRHDRFGGDCRDDIVDQIISVFLICRTHFSTPAFPPSSEYVSSRSCCQDDSAYITRTCKTPDPCCSWWTPTTTALVPIETMTKVVYNTRFDLPNKTVELKVCCRPVNLECSEKVEGSIGKVEMTRVHESETKVQRSRCEWWSG